MRTRHHSQPNGRAFKVSEGWQVAGLLICLITLATSCEPQFPTVVWSGVRYEVSCATVDSDQLAEGPVFVLDGGQPGKDIEGVHSEEAIAIFMSLPGCGGNKKWLAGYRTTLTNEERAAVERIVERDQGRDASASPRD
jgi:hypothetical protein